MQSVSNKEMANLKVEDGRRMGDEKILEGGGTRVRPKNSVKEGEVGMIR